MRRSLKYLLLGVVALASGFSFAQQNVHDSLKTLLKNPGLQDTTRLDILFQLIENTNDDHLWPHYNEQAHTLAMQLIGDKRPEIKRKGKKGLADAMNNTGYIYYSHGQMQKALEYYQKSLAVQEELADKTGIATLLNNIGLIYDNLGQIERALEFFSKALAIQEEIRDRRGVANSLNNIGAIYESQ